MVLFFKGMKQFMDKAGVCSFILSLNLQEQGLGKILQFQWLTEPRII